MRILLVEDEPDFLRTIAQALREEGYAVDAAQDGEEGLYKAQETDYDAIVLDAMLPYLNGFDLLRRLRQKKKTPILMLTARAKVSELLDFLVQNRARIVTRTQLYEHLHDENDTPISNLVDVHIFNLRKKLGADFVVTHRGQGYSVGL